MRDIGSCRRAGSKPVNGKGGRTHVNSGTLASVRSEPVCRSRVNGKTGLAHAKPRHAGQTVRLDCRCAAPTSFDGRVDLAPASSGAMAPAAQGGVLWRCRQWQNGTLPCDSSHPGSCPPEGPRWCRSRSSCPPFSPGLNGQKMSPYWHKMSRYGKLFPVRRRLDPGVRAVGQGTQFQRVRWTQTSGRWGQ